MIDFSIQNISVADIPLLTELHKKSFPHGFWSQSQLTSTIELKTTIALCLREKNSDALLGFILVQCLDAEAEILTICVAPSHRKLSLGSALLDAALGAARLSGASKMFLEVAEDNQAAITFYEKNGFSVTGLRKGYYKRDNLYIDAKILYRNVKEKSVEC